MNLTHSHTTPATSHKPVFGTCPDNHETLETRRKPCGSSTRSSSFPPALGRGYSTDDTTGDGTVKPAAVSCAQERKHDD